MESSRKAAVEGTDVMAIDGGWTPLVGDQARRETAARLPAPQIGDFAAYRETMEAVRGRTPATPRTACQGVD
ncbi:hypothetical protein GCM10009772_15730 [Pseudonocardia alni subsp. carboxydivorans]